MTQEAFEIFLKKHPNAWQRCNQLTKHQKYKSLNIFYTNTKYTMETILNSSNICQIHVKNFRILSVL